MEQLGQGRPEVTAAEFKPSLSGSLLRVTPNLSVNANHVVAINHLDQLLHFTDTEPLTVASDVISLVEQHLSGQSNQRQNAGMFDFPSDGIGGLGDW